MKRAKVILCILVALAAVCAIVLLLRSENALVTNPKGIIARKELRLITTNILLMLSIIVPTYILLFFVAWKYRAKKGKVRAVSDKSLKLSHELTLWIIPSIIIAVMIVITWKATHELDPHLPLISDAESLEIQVVALDWKWLFIYPKEGIASLNFLQFPEQTPIRFVLTAGPSPMNSFWIPELSGQIYAMSGMTTQLHVMADGQGEYRGRAAEINGSGYADMTFIAKSSSRSDFESWVAQAKKSPLQLTSPIYGALAHPSKNLPVTLYSHVERGLFDKIVMGK